MKATALCERWRILRLRTALPHCKSAILSTTTHKNSETKTWQNRNFAALYCSAPQTLTHPPTYSNPTIAVWSALLLDRGSSVGAATRYWLDGLGFEFRWWWDFSQLSSTAVVATQPPYAMGTRPFTGVKRLGRGVDQPPLSSAEVKERVRYASIYLCAYIACNMVVFTFHLNTNAVFTEVVIFNWWRDYTYMLGQSRGIRSNANRKKKLS
jgi:hypothetical protein